MIFVKTTVQFNCENCRFKSEDFQECFTHETECKKIYNRYQEVANEVIAILKERGIRISNYSFNAGLHYTINERYEPLADFRVYVGIEGNDEWQCISVTTEPIDYLSDNQIDSFENAKDVLEKLDLQIIEHIMDNDENE
jgi:hypothetical protein